MLTFEYILVSGKQQQIHVKYFNWNGATAFLLVKNVFEFKDIDHFWEQIELLRVKKSKLKAFSKSCYKAIEEANFFMQYPIEDRTRIFDDVLTLQAEQKRTAGYKSSEPTPSENIASTSRLLERKSIDSALESVGSPASSYEPTKHLDPIESYLQTMQAYDAHDHRQKKERRSKNVVEKPKESTISEDPNRRKSFREPKKRRFEEFEEDSKTATNLPASEASLSTSGPKPKKQKVAKEETLEERFLLDPLSLRQMFRSLSKKRICMECLQSTKEATHRCAGNGTIRCSGWFHQSCAGHSEMKHEEIRHQCGDSDEIIQTQAMKMYLTCKSCLSGTKKCFVCDLLVEGIESSSETQHCPALDCQMAYHKKCLKLWPQNKISKVQTKRNNLCPQHTCHTCFSKDLHNTGALAKCLKCPSAYHLQVACLPAGTRLVSQTQLICPRHLSDKEKQNEKASKPVNIDFCNVCSQNGNLVCCESCPSAFHPECINYEESDEKFICQECQDGRLPLYNSIVWARVGAYRWWPGLIMPNHVIPELTLKSQRSDREFCVRFFGSYDYCWFTCDRIFPYDGTIIAGTSGSSRLNLAFKVAIEEARVMSNILDKGNTEILTAKPKPYTRITQNRPVPPVKLRKEEHTPEKCSCKATDPSPCGRNSNCINMHVNVECNKLTCPAGVTCQNQKMRKREYVDLKIVHTQHRGFGAACIKDIPEDTLVIEYVGELIDTIELNRRMAEKLGKNEKEFYFLTIEGDLYVDAGPSGNLARFINHSCEPNCVTRKVLVEGNTRIGIFSNQPIKAVSSRNAFKIYFIKLFLILGHRIDVRLPNGIRWQQENRLLLRLIELLRKDRRKAKGYREEESHQEET